MKQYNTQNGHADGYTYKLSIQLHADIVSKINYRLLDFDWNY